MVIIMTQLPLRQKAGNALRRLIQENYSTQEDFAYDYGLDIRSVSRYINNGISKIDTIQELAEFFKVDYTEFFKD